jgi:protocatechuate 3,4-dioxygenase beta subunit
MSLSPQADSTRRALLRLGLLLPASAALAACGGRALETITQRTAAAQEMGPTPACDPDGSATRAQTEGPYFTRNSPQRRSLLDAEVGGARLVLAGTVFSRQCQPVAGALLDFWQADDAGRYDNVGYRFRGHQFTDEAGRYELETVVPGLYPGRTRHIHVKVQAPNGPVLTTQLYFPDEARNRTDGIFNSALVMGLNDAESGKAASFDFVVSAA